MNLPYAIVRYRPMHKMQVAEVASQLWSGGTDLAVRYFEWKYEENPYAPEPTMYLAFSGSELVGIRGFYGARWESGQGTSRVVDSVSVADDLWVAPAHRNRGVVTLIMRAACEDLARRGHHYLLNLTGSEVTVIGSLAMGWRTAGPMEPIARRSESLAPRVREVLRRTPFLWRYAASPLLRTRREREPFHGLDTTRSLAKGGVVSVSSEPRIDAMSGLVERLGGDGRIRHVRDREFFLWRFRNPLGAYRFLYLGGERLEGYLVLKTAYPVRDRPSVRIVDLEASSDAIRSQLLDAAIRGGRFPELFTWASALSGGTRQLLSGRGFEPVDLEARAHGCPCILVKAISAVSSDEPWMLSGRRITDPRAWDLRMISTMAG